MLYNKIGIICAVESEKQELLKRYSYVLKRVYDLKFYLFKKNEKEIILVKCGVGKINATRATQILIDKFDVEFVINYGTAGGREKSLSYGDIVVAISCVQADADCTVFGLPKGKFEKNDELYVVSDHSIISYIKNITKEIVRANNKIVFANIATFDQFIIDEDFNRKLKEEFNVVCADMESVAVAITCKACKIPYVVIRGISNILGEKYAVDSYNKLSSKTSSDCIDIIQKLIL